MTDQFVAEIRVFPFTFTPTGWAFCNGQLLPLSQNTALFSLLGTFYGGDGKSTFALPNLQGSAAVHPEGQGSYFDSIGVQGGSQTVTLLQSEIPAHSHVINAVDVTGDNAVPTGNVLARYPGTYQTTTNANRQDMAFQTLSPAGSDLPHNNMMPSLVFNYCIALQGIFPARG